MSSTRWPLVVDWLLDTLPTLPGWSSVAVFDADPITAATPAAYAVVARSANDTASGTYARSVHVSGLTSEVGTVVVQVVTRTGDNTPDQVRSDGFALVDALDSALIADHTFGGILGEAGTVSTSVAVQSIANSGGVAQSLLITVSYTSLT